MISSSFLYGTVLDAVPNSGIDVPGPNVRVSFRPLRRLVCLGSCTHFKVAYRKNMRCHHAEELFVVAPALAQACVRVDLLQFLAIIS